MKFDLKYRFLSLHHSFSFDLEQILDLEGIGLGLSSLALHQGMFCTNVPWRVPLITTAWSSTPIKINRRALLLLAGETN